MTETHLDFDELRKAARTLAERRQDARKSYFEHAKAAAGAERDYRREKSIEFAKARSDEKGIGESEIIADGQTAELRHKRDLSQALAKADLLRIDEIEREQATLRQLADWSQRMDGVMA